MNIIRLLFVFTTVALLVGCGSLQKSPPQNSSASANARVVDKSDPLQGLNRSIYQFNDGADRVLVRPVAKGYQTVVPPGARKSVGNFFSNLGEPLNAINNLLQGKGDRTLSSIFRFTVNSTIGIGGLFDVASKMDVPQAKEDLGQTLAVWGVGSGPYVMLPIFGPSNLRDSLSFATQSVAYYPNGEITDDGTGRVALSVLDAINTRANLLGTDSILEAQLDPYAFLKSSYEQSRLREINDGVLPELESNDELDF